MPQRAPDPVLDALELGDLDAALERLSGALEAARERHATAPLALADVLDLLAAALFETFDQERAWPAAERLWEETLALRESALGARDPLIADVLGSLGVLHYYRGTWERAAALAERALAILEEAPAHDTERALVLQDLGRIYLKQGRTSAAREMVERSVAIFDALARAPASPVPPSPSSPPSAVALDIADWAESMNILADVARIQNRYADAERLFRRALFVLREAETGSYLEPHLLQNLALTLKDQGRFDGADEMMGRALALLEKRGSPLELAVALHNRAEIYRVQGRLAEAQPEYERALALARPLFPGGSADLALMINQQALLFDELGRTTAARERYTEALRMLEDSVRADHPLVAQTSNDLAGLECRSGDFNAGRDRFRRALAIREATLGGDNPEVAVTLTALARCLVDESWDSAAEATRLVERALRLFAATSAYPWAEADALALRAELAARAGRVERAVEDLERAIALVEEQRPLIGGGETSRAEFLRRYLAYYDRMVGWQIELGDAARAFEFAERARARVFLDQLAAGGVDVRRGIPDDVRGPLEGDERRVRALLAELQQRLAYVRASDELEGDEKARRLAELEADLDAATREYQRLGSELRRASPLWREVVTAGGESLDLARTQRELVPPGGFLLLYQIGERESFLFALPEEGEAEVARLEVSEVDARRLGLPPGALTAEGLDVALAGGVGTGAGAGSEGGGLPGLMSQLRGDRGLVKVSADPEVVPRSARPVDRLHALFRLLVPGELWSRLRDASEVIVLPDGALHRLPFEALVVDLPQDEGGARFWLDDGPVMRYNASATALFNLERTRQTAAVGDSVLVVADPLFDGGATDGGSPHGGGHDGVASDGGSADGGVQVSGALEGGAMGSPAVGAASSAAPSFEEAPSLDELPSSTATSPAHEWPGSRPDAAAAAAAEPTRAAYLRAGGSLERLPGTAREAAAIRSALGGARVQVLVGAEARETQVRGLADRRQRYLHFATHGLVDEGRSALLASLALTPPPAGTARTEDDGFLQLFEIYELDLDAELAVLSACDSHVGRRIAGEGAFALSRGFLAAGARRVVASQWPVDDASTAVLMGALYERLAAAEERGEDVDYATALRDARRVVRETPGWEAPYFWAPFVLSGVR